MEMMVHSLSWVMQDFYHQPHYCLRRDNSLLTGHMGCFGTFYRRAGIRGDNIPRIIPAQVESSK